MRRLSEEGHIDAVTATGVLVGRIPQQASALEVPHGAAVSVEDSCGYNPVS